MDDTGAARHDQGRLHPGLLFDRFVDLFRGRDLLGRTIRVRHRNRLYRLYCGEDRFLAYRLNPNPGISPGVPGWLCCLVTPEAVIDGGSGDGGPEEPAAGDWLACIAAGEYHHI